MERKSMMIEKLINRYPALAPLREQLSAAVDMMEETYRAGGKVLLCGNGGSAADCDHIVGELMKGFLLHRGLSKAEKAHFEGLCEDAENFAAKLQGAIPAISLPAQAAVFTAYCNDVDADMIYAQLTYGYGRAGDLFIGLSTSGNSKNVVNGAIAAKAKGLRTLALTGQKDSRLSALCDLTLQAPETETYLIQEYHLSIYHCLCAELEYRIFSEEQDNA